MTLIFLILFLLFIVFIFYILYNHHPYSKNYLSVSEVLEYADNGDIILFSGNQYSENLIKFYTGSYFTHISFLFRENGILYIWEADMGQHYRDGPRVIKFKDKIKRWKGNKIAVWKKFMGHRPILQDILKVIGKYINLNMDMSMISWAFSNYPNSSIFKYFKDLNTVFCSELIVMTLRDLNIINLQKHPTFYIPENFFNDDLKFKIMNNIKPCYSCSYYFKF